MPPDSFASGDAEESATAAAVAAAAAASASARGAGDVAGQSSLFCDSFACLPESLMQLQLPSEEAQQPALDSMGSLAESVPFVPVARASMRFSTVPEASLDDTFSPVPRLLGADATKRPGAAGTAAAEGGAQTAASGDQGSDEAALGSRMFGAECPAWAHAACGMLAKELQAEISRQVAGFRQEAEGRAAKVMQQIASYEAFEEERFSRLEKFVGSAVAGLAGVRDAEMQDWMVQLEARVGQLEAERAVSQMALASLRSDFDSREAARIEQRTVLSEMSTQMEMFNALEDAIRALRQEHDEIVSSSRESFLQLEVALSATVEELARQQARLNEIVVPATTQGMHCAHDEDGVPTTEVTHFFDASSAANVEPETSAATAAAAVAAAAALDTSVEGVLRQLCLSPAHQQAILDKLRRRRLPMEFLEMQQ